VIPNLAGVVEQALLFGSGGCCRSDDLLEGLIFQFSTRDQFFGFIHVGFVVLAVVEV